MKKLLPLLAIAACLTACKKKDNTPITSEDKTDYSVSRIPVPEWQADTFRMEYSTIGNTMLRDTFYTYVNSSGQSAMKHKGNEYIFSIDMSIKHPFKRDGNMDTSYVMDISKTMKTKKLNKYDITFYNLFIVEGTTGAKSWEGGWITFTPDDAITLLLGGGTGTSQQHYTWMSAKHGRSAD